ncbi:MAG: hypothetical protein V6Z78_05125 [Holosporaceae bacterium]
MIKNNIYTWLVVAGLVGTASYLGHRSLKARYQKEAPAGVAILQDRSVSTFVAPSVSQSLSDKRPVTSSVLPEKKALPSKNLPAKKTFHVVANRSDSLLSLLPKQTEKVVQATPVARAQFVQEVIENGAWTQGAVRHNIKVKGHHTQVVNNPLQEKSVDGHNKEAVGSGTTKKAPPALPASTMPLTPPITPPGTPLASPTASPPVSPPVSPPTSRPTSPIPVSSDDSSSSESESESESDGSYLSSLLSGVESEASSSSSSSESEPEPESDTESGASSDSEEPAAPVPLPITRTPAAMNLSTDYYLSTPGSATTSADQSPHSARASRLRPTAVPFDIAATTVVPRPAALVASPARPTERADLTTDYYSSTDASSESEHESENNGSASDVTSLSSTHVSSAASSPRRRASPQSLRSRRALWRLTPRQRTTPGHTSTPAADGTLSPNAANNLLDAFLSPIPKSPEREGTPTQSPLHQSTVISSSFHDASLGCSPLSSSGEDFKPEPESDNASNAVESSASTPKRRARYENLSDIWSPIETSPASKSLLVVASPARGFQSDPSSFLNTTRSPDKMRANQTPKTHNTSLQAVPAYDDEAQVAGAVRMVLSQRTNLHPNAPLSPKNGRSTTHRRKKMRRTLDVTSPSFGPSYAQMVSKNASPETKVPLTPTDGRRWSQPTTPTTGLKDAQMQPSPAAQTPKAPTQPRSPNTEELFAATQARLSPGTLDTERREKLASLAARVRYVDVEQLDVLKAEGRPYGLKVTDERTTTVLPLKQPSKLKVTDERTTTVLPLKQPSKPKSFQPEPGNAESEDYVQMDPLTPKFDPDATPRTPEFLGPVMNERPVPGAHKQTPRRKATVHSEVLTPRREFQGRLHDALRGAKSKRARGKVVARFQKEAEAIGVEIINTKNGIECVNRKVKGLGPLQSLVHSPKTAFWHHAKDKLDKARTNKEKTAVFNNLTLDAPVLGFKVTGNPDNFSIEEKSAISQKAPPSSSLSPTPFSKRTWADVAKSPPTPGAKILHGPEKKAATAPSLPSISANSSFQVPEALSASGFLEESTDFVNMSDASSCPASAAGNRSVNTSTASDRHLANLHARTATDGSAQKKQTPRKPSSLRQQVLSPRQGSPLKRATTASVATPSAATTPSKLSYAQMAASPPSPAAKILYGPEKKTAVSSASPPMGQSTPMTKTPKAAAASFNDAFASQRDRLNRELHQRWASKNRTQPGKSNVGKEMGPGIVLNAAKQPLATADSQEEAKEGKAKGSSPYMRSNGRDGAYISLRSSVDRAVSMAGRTGPVDRSLRGAERSAAVRDRFRAAVGRVILRNRAAKNGTRMLSVHRDISRGRGPSSTWSRPSRRD